MLAFELSTETKIKSKPLVKICQLESLPQVKFLYMNTFGERLKIAFGNARNAEIARKIGISEPAIKKYMSGSLPSIDNLIVIKNLTGRSLDWLIQGENETPGEAGVLEAELATLLRQVAAEQSNVVFAEAEIGGVNLERRTLDLLANYLLARALKVVNLIDSEKDVMSAADLKRAERFTFVANIPQSLDDRIGEIIEKKMSGKGVSQVAQEGDIRDMIRELVQEEVAKSKLVPVFPLRLSDSEDEEQDIPRRKAG